MNNLGYYNGTIMPLEKLKIDATDRAVYFGDGVYEVVYSINQKPFALDEHINRFYNSLKLLKINFKMTKENLKSLLKSLVKQQGSLNQLIYWQVSRASALRSHIFPEKCTPNLLIMITEDKIKNMKKMKFNVILEEDTRFFHCNIKTINLIPSVLASEKAKQQNCDEAVLHRGEMITECAHSNVAIIKDGVFKTAPLNNLILPGVTRSHLISFCKKLKIPVMEKPFSIQELMNADEVIVCASGCLCMPVSSINKKPVGGRNLNILEKLQNEYIKKITKECGDFNII